MRSTENSFVRHPLCEPLRVTRGTADRTPVHPREVFRKAIQYGGKGFVSIRARRPDLFGQTASEPLQENRF